MNDAGRRIHAFAAAALFALCQSTTAYAGTSMAESESDSRAGWYWGLGLHGLSSDGEHDGGISRRVLTSWVRASTRADASTITWASKRTGSGPRAVFEADVWNDTLNAEARMRQGDGRGWNTALTAMFHIPWKSSLIEPHVYAEIGRSFWEYEVGLSTTLGGEDHV